MSDSLAPGVDGGNALSQKMAKATICTIIRLDIRLNSMVDWAYLTRSLMVRMKRSISGTWSFLDAQFRFIPRAVIYLRIGSKSQSVCICVILKPRCRYNLCTCVIPSAMYPNLFWVVSTRFFSWIIFINDCIYIFIGSPK